MDFWDLFHQTGNLIILKTEKGEGEKVKKKLCFPLFT